MVGGEESVDVEVMPLGRRAASADTAGAASRNASIMPQLRKPIMRTLISSLLSPLLRRWGLVMPLVVVFATCLAGCGSGDDPQLGEVSGRVTLDGEPLAGAFIQFQPDQGRSSYAETDADGKYELSYMPGKPGAIVGTHTVRVTTSEEISTEGSGDADMGGPAGTPAPVTRLTSERVPPQYNIRSELRKTVERGKNSIDLELKSRR
jgi:hypothetical protein